ncbi:adenylate kinase [Spiroplasma culicicola]|uniref:Adenylate kinase n=1 Tax=Spiroplasma culicicola AES-1 TaxID=1276246 RepID=W6A829_9MOLU|nr:adenylate kinase [Spiroplasma culicicola]AHI53288.1 adenylate kinase [Spiroplasma culicicola AES-1]
MNIILLGAPGSGKGTQSELLCEKKGFIQLSTGDLFRNNIANNTALGMEAQTFMNQGLYVPDEITNKMVEAYLEQTHDNLIFDGYPRTVDQSVELDKMLSNLGQTIDKVIYFEIDNSVLMERLTGRLICQICKRSYHKVNRKPLKEGVCDFDGGDLITRPDDQEDKIKTRLEVYNTQTAPLIDFYQAKLTKVDATNKSVEQLYELLVEALNQ